MNELNRRVTLLCGDATFETTALTLTRLPNSYFARLVQNNPLENVFEIDDGKHLKYISEMINYLRDGRVPLPDGIDAIDELKEEAKAMQMPELLNFIESEEQRGPPFFRGDKVEWKDKNPYRMFQSLKWNIKDDDASGSTDKVPLCFQSDYVEEHICPLCGVNSMELREIYQDNYRTLFSEPRSASQSVAVVWKVHTASCCVDISFAFFSYVFHVPAKLLQLSTSQVANDATLLWWKIYPKTFSLPEVQHFSLPIDPFDSKIQNNKS